MQWVQEKDNPDLLFVIDIRSKSLEAMNFKDLVGQVLGRERGNSSIIVVGRNNRRWTLVGRGQDRTGGMLYQTAGAAPSCIADVVISGRLVKFKLEKWSTTLIVFISNNFFKVQSRKAPILDFTELRMYTGYEDMRIL